MKLKKLMALLLAGTMALSTLPMAAMADDDDDWEEEYWEEGFCWENPAPIAYTKTDNGQVDAGTGEKAVNEQLDNIRIEGEGNSLTVTEQVVSTDSDGFAPVQVLYGAELNLKNGLDATGADESGPVRTIHVLGYENKSSLNIDGDVLQPQGSHGIYVEENADATINGDIKGGVQGIDVSGSGNANVTVNGSIDSRSGNGYQGFYANNGTLDITGDVASLVRAASVCEDANVHVGGDVIVGGLETQPSEYDESFQPNILWVTGDSTLIIDKNFSVGNDLAYSSETAVIEGSDLKVGGDFTTDLMRAIKVNDSDSKSMVEVVGDINGYIDVDANSDITVIVGGILDGKLVLNGELESKEELEEEHTTDDESEDESGEAEGAAAAASSEVRTLADYADPTEWANATFVLWKAVDEDGNIATEEDMFVLDLPEYEDKTTVEERYVDCDEKSDDKNLEKTPLETDLSKKAYQERTFYIIKEADPDNVKMDIYGDYVRDFTGVEDANKGTNDYQAVRQGQYFEVAVNAPKGCKVTLTAGENDGIEVIPMKDGTFQVWVNAAGGGINLAATFEKIMKSFKVEKATSSSSAPSFRVTDQKASLAADKAKLTAKVNCSNMDYARKLLANVRFYLDEELSENKYYTVYLNDNGELEVELSPELIAMIEAGYHLVEMVLDNGTNVPFDINLIKD